MLQRSPPESVISTTVSRSKANIDDTETLWRKIYGEEFGWISDFQAPNEDAYHARSYYAVCRMDDAPVGTMRIVSQADPGFYITHKLGSAPIADYIRPGIEVQRLMVRHEFRERRTPNAPYGAYGCLVKACLHFALAMGMDWVLADCHKNIDIGPLKSMRKMGFQETGHVFRDNAGNGEECIVMIIQTKDWICDVARRRSRFNQYLFSHDPTLAMEL